MADYKLPIITGTSLTIGDILRWNGNDWVNYPDSNYGGVGFVDRGDPAAVDKATGNFTVKETATDLDLSAIVTDSDATAILIALEIKTALAGKRVQFRKNGNNNWPNSPPLETQINNQRIYGNLTIPCDSNQVIEYWIQNVVWDTLNLTVMGWWRS